MRLDLEVMTVIRVPGKLLQREQGFDAIRQRLA